MSSKTQIPLKKFTDEFELENLTHDIDIEGRMLKQKFVNRPARAFLTISTIPVYRLSDE